MSEAVTVNVVAEIYTLPRGDLGISRNPGDMEITTCLRRDKGCLANYHCSRGTRPLCVILCRHGHWYVVIVGSFAGQRSHNNPVLQRGITDRDWREELLLRHVLLLLIE